MVDLKTLRNDYDARVEYQEEIPAIGDVINCYRCGYVQMKTILSLFGKFTNYTCHCPERTKFINEIKTERPLLQKEVDSLRAVDDFYLCNQHPDYQVYQTYLSKEKAS